MHPCWRSKRMIKKKIHIKTWKQRSMCKTCITKCNHDRIKQIGHPCPNKWTYVFQNIFGSWFYLVLYKYSIKVSCVSEYQIFLDLVLHFLKTYVKRTPLNWSKGILLMFWIWKKSCTRFGQTWSNSIDLKQ
jgi:hypothetical protein